MRDTTTSRAAPHASSPARPGSRARAAWYWAAVAGLLLAHVTLALSAAGTMSATCDELAHLTAGVANLATGDFRLVPEHPPLGRMWCALPVVLDRPVLPTLEQPAWWLSNQWAFGRQLLYELGNDADRLLRLGRTMNVLFSVGTGLLVLLWSRQLFGPAAGLLALGLYAFDPAAQAHGALITTDMSAAFFLLASAWAVWSVLQKVTVPHLILSTLCVSGLLLSKMSGVLIVPITAALVVVRLLRRAPLELHLGRRFLATTRRQQAGVVVAVTFLHVAVAAGCIWAAYGFRYRAMMETVPARDRFVTYGRADRYDSPWDHELRNARRIGNAIRRARDRRLLPEAYLYGSAHTVNMVRSRDAFLNGERSSTGFFWYFPYTFLVKTPLPTLVVVAVGGGVLVRRLRNPGALGEDLYGTSPLWALLVVYWLSAVTSHFNIGHRHLLPIYPALYVLVGSLATARAVPPTLRWTAAGLTALTAIASVSSWPHQLAYFNWLIGDPNHAHEHLVDSNLDWGQDMRRLGDIVARYAREGHAPPRVYVSSLSNVPPSYYGIDAIRLPSSTSDSLHRVGYAGGLYCISATMLQQVYLLPLSHWSPGLERAYQSRRDHLLRIQNDPIGPQGPPVVDIETPDGITLKLAFGRLCAALREREPDERAGKSTFIYDLSDAEVHDALFGPPPPMADDNTDALVELARHVLVAGDPALCTALLSEAVAREPNNAHARYWLGYALQHQQQFDAALANYLVAAEADPDVPGVYTNIGLVLARQGRAAEAIEMFQLALEREPYLPELHFNLSITLGRVGRAQDAVEAARRAISLRPANPMFHLQLAHMLMQSGRAAEVSAAYHAARQQAGPHMHDAGSLRNWADLLSAAGASDDAAAALREADDLESQPAPQVPDPRAP